MTATVRMMRYYSRPSSLGNVLRWRARDIDAWLEDRKGM